MKRTISMGTVVLGLLIAFPPLQAAEPLGFNVPAEDAELSDSRGMADHYQLQVGELSQTATLSDNEIGTAYTGGNYLHPDAFGRVSGLAFIVQNSGNHVIIQESMLLNFAVTP